MNGWILFFVCGLIDYIARKTKNKRTDIVNWLGKDRLQKIYDLADVYHCDNIDRVCEDFIEEAKIPDGIFDNVADCRYAIPSHWDIAKVYKRLIKQVAQEKQIGIVDALIKVYNSFSVQRLMIITAAFIMKIHLICWSATWKIQFYKLNLDSNVDLKKTLE